MKRLTRIALVIATPVFLGAAGTLADTRPPAAQAAGWTGDIKESLAAASETDATILLLLCAQDTAPMDQASVAAARDRLGANTIFVNLAWPEDPRVQPAMAKRFLAWADRYETRKLPAVLLLDAQGRVYARLPADAVTDGRMARAIDTAAQCRAQRDAALQRAQAKTGQDRAAELDLALEQVKPFITTDYRDLAQEIVDLDPDDSAGLHTKYRRLLAVRDLDELIQGTIYPLIDAGRYADARAALGQVLADWPLSPDSRQLLLGFQAQLYYSEGQRDKALQMLDEALAEAPNSPAAKKLRHAREQIESLPEVE